MGGTLQLSTIPKEGKEMSENFGGKTGYYDLPKPDRVILNNLLADVFNGNIGIDSAVNTLYELFPNTLNDIIEYKGLKPWQHEVLKATYALDERAAKATDGSSSREREINKIQYYLDRGRNLK
jgi:hypothetical protein